MLTETTEVAAMNEPAVGQLVDTYTAQVYVLPQGLVTIGKLWLGIRLTH